MANAIIHIQIPILDEPANGLNPVGIVKPLPKYRQLYNIILLQYLGSNSYSGLVAICGIKVKQKENFIYFLS
ncbi:hypothetical protein K8N75_00600 [Methanobacterium sp. VT]|uniref:Uncharacterized protein n=1 Tax=Methanobacterium spitsbergense TaxID=2874285 RepID=A0A8T5ULJ9_9EURY|nr:hypothetical protein [Methanobacterium spitsbergense]MBZ2164554.1 hypothetical protein [Methanobacterium spitsbergense]